MKRFRDLLKGTKLYPKIEFITNEAQDGFLRELGKNDFLHSKNIENILDRLVPDFIKEDECCFDKGEIYLLLVSIYLHDIGRKIDPFHHEKESYRVIRENPSLYHLNNFEADAVSQICVAHAKEEVWPIERNDPSFGIADLSFSGRTFNLQILGALLRLCDELDNTYIRTRGIISQTNSVRNIIRDINPIYEYGRIEIQASPKNWSEYELLLGVRNYTHERLREIQKFLKSINLHYYQIWLNPENFQGPINIDTKEPSFQEFILDIGLLLENRYSDIKLYEKISNIEIPIICVEKKIGIETKTAVYCCLEIGIDAAREISGALSFLKAQNKVDIGVVVTKKDVSNEIKEIFQTKGIHIEDIDVLIDNLYSFKNAFAYYIKKLSNKEINQKLTYIEARGILENGNPIENIENYINNWIENDSSVQLTILGDFGVGKTTICERIVLEKSKELNQKDLINTKSRIPILIELKNYTESVSIESLITNYLVNELNIDMSFKVFETLNKRGRFLIILDGFDEIANLTDEKTVLKTFLELDKLAEPNSKIILSCRTHFFKTNDDIHTMHKGSKLYNTINNKFGYSFLFIEDFNIEQIESYLMNWDKENYNLYINSINSIYNLKDLATRPVLLNLIAKTIPQLSSESELIINSSVLYKTYIRFWLERDDWRTKVNVRQRKELSEKIVEYFYMNDVSVMHYTQLIEFCKLLSFNEYNLEILDFELRTCNFMKRDANGNYMFVHKSFQEYILATIIFDQIFSEDKIGLKWILPLEKEYYRHSSKIVSKETQLFFLQLMENKIHYYTSEELIKISGIDPRKMNLLINTILILDNKCYGLFFTKYLLNQDMVLENKKILNYIIDSYDFNSCVAFLSEQVSIIGVNYSKNIYELLLLNGINKSRLNDLEKSIVKFETDVEIIVDEFVDSKNDSYPYRKEIYLLQLNSLISDIDSLDEINAIKANFKREWTKEKAEYDQKVKRNKGIEKKINNEKFNFNQADDSLQKIE